MNEKNKQLLFNVLGCLTFLSLPVLFSPDFNSSELLKIPPFQRDFAGYVMVLLFFYANYFYFLPEFYFKKKYLLFVLSLVVSYAVIAYIPFLIVPSHQHLFRLPPNITPDMVGDMAHFPPMHPDNNFQHAFSQHFFQFLIMAIFSLLLKINMNLKRSEKEKLNAQLAYLKAQINPHFLFNTLNGIYSSAIQEKAKNTSSAILKLSGMMRYIISESQTDFVSLEKEINYIENYIELQKIRLGETVRISYQLNGAVFGKRIAPLIIIAFIENAFKHGVNPEENSVISIRINIEEQDLNLEVKNNKVTVLHEPDSESGLGIENTKTRLTLLYPSAHLLFITENQFDYNVSLKIKIE